MKNLGERREEYSASLDMNNFSDSEAHLESKLREKKLVLPINTKQRNKEKRI